MISHGGETLGTSYCEACSAHLEALVRDCALNSENGAVTVKVIENPDSMKPTCDKVIGMNQAKKLHIRCSNKSDFRLTYHMKHSAQAVDSVIGPSKRQRLTKTDRRLN